MFLVFYKSEIILRVKYIWMMVPARYYLNISIYLHENKHLNIIIILECKIQIKFEMSSQTNK